MKYKIGVLFGGVSVEHEVSIITAVQAMKHMDTVKYDIVPIYITKEGSWYTGAMLKDMQIYNDMDLLKRYAKEVVLYKKDGRFILQSKGLIKREIAEVDLCLPIMHGTNGEDGSLQGYLKTVGVPFGECDLFSACVGQDKIFMKQIWRDSNVPVVKYDWFYDADFMQDSDSIIKRLEKLGYPMIVKPARLGSSVGIGVAHNEEELRDVILDAINYDTKILVEEMIEDLTEVNISVLGNYHKQKVSVIEEVGGTKEILSYDDKYKGGSKKAADSQGMASAKRIIPARISDDLSNQVSEIAKRAFKSLGSSGVVRIDFLIDNKNNKVYANEINSIPGSLAFYLWEKTGKEYHELLDDVIEIAIRDYKDSLNKTYSFDTNIIKDFGKGTKGVKGVKK